MTYVAVEQSRRPRSAVDAEALALGYLDIYHANDHIEQIMAHGPVGLEGFDDHLAADMHKKGLHPDDVALLPQGGGGLLVELSGATREEAEGRARGLVPELRGQEHRSPC